MRLRNVAGLGEQQRHRVLGGGDDVRLRRVDHHHAAGGGVRDVDVVEPDAGATDDDELGAASSTSAVTWVAERMIRACAVDTTPISCSCVRSVRTSTVCPASRSRSSPPSAISSVTRMRAMTGMLIAPPPQTQTIERHVKRPLRVPSRVMAANVNQGAP